ncbi:MAG: response regulator transcription factor [Cryomorphaceae bacterium]|nr:response regulator transcription factor [Cryomorphaceae bacterium]
MNNKKCVIVADDHSIVRRGIHLLFSRIDSSFDVIEADTFPRTIELLKTRQPDLVVLDINLPGGNSSKMMAEIMSISPHCKVLVFTSYEEDVYAEAFLRAGALGYVNKLSPENDIEDAIKTTLEGKTYVSPQFQSKLKDRTSKKGINPLNHLSKRELEVGRLLAAGDGNLLIMEQLNLKPSTISTYKQRIFQKLKVNNIAELISTFNKYDVD